MMLKTCSGIVSQLQVIELFSRRRWWALTLAQSSNKFGYFPSRTFYCFYISIVFILIFIKEYKIIIIIIIIIII